MRPIRLQMVAFGPFADVEVIDFSALGKNPLFLINGPTGSGKSSILDAICFALYGETSGNEREARQMRCDHALPETLTEITLEFELFSGIYRVTRIPEQNRPKARGEGFTEQKARAELFKIEDENETLIAAPKITEVTDAVIQLTGLSAAQFRQVMILPQGKFRDLLLATSEDRETIFVRLFQTHIYSQLQQQLKDKTNKLLASLSEIQLQKKALLTVHELETAGALVDKIKTLSESITLLLQQQKDLSEKCNIFQEKRQKAESLAKIFVEHAQISEKLKSFENNRSVIQGYKEKVQFSALAKQINSNYAKFKQQRALFDDAIKKMADNTAVVERSEVALKKIESETLTLPEKENELKLVEANIVLLKSYRERSQQLAEAQKNFDNIEKISRLSVDESNERQKQLGDEKLKQEKIEKEHQEKTLSSMQLPQKEIVLKSLNDQGEKLRKVSDLNKTLSQITEDISKLVKQEAEVSVKFQAKNSERESYEMAWQKGQAAILAAELLTDEPCIVCGSTDHPSIAKTDGKLPTEKELNDLRAQSEKLKNSTDTLKHNRLLKEKEQKSINELISHIEIDQGIIENKTLADVRRSYKKCRDEIEGLKKIALEIPILSRQSQEIKANIVKLETAYSISQKKASEKQAEVASARTNVDLKKAELPEKFSIANNLETEIHEKVAVKSTLQSNITSLRQQHLLAREAKVAACSALTSAESHHQSMELQLKSSGQAWQETLRNSTFDNEKDFLTADMDGDAESKLIGIIRNYEDSRMLLEKNLEEKKQIIQNLDQPDVKQLIENEKKVIEEKNQTDAQYHRSMQRVKDFESTQERISKLVSQQNSLEKEYSVVGKLNDISNGKNAHNLSLQRFVLSVLLDDVLIEASHRLNKMSKGRFRLYRKETVSDKRAKAGLDLEVEDAYTGKQRPAATLSGGESFMAALALALGLSDVVQSYAGGIRLDMLFIDEGFGSLDPESLELAIGTLLDLRDSGRLVGIISHVEELKRMIDIRLDVKVDRERSTTCLVGI